MTASLVVLVPLLVLAVVTLLAFAGCEPFKAGAPMTEEPKPKPKPPGNGTGPGPGNGGGTTTAEPYRDAIVAEAGLRGYWRLGDTGATAKDWAPAMPHDGTYQPGVTKGVPGALAIGKGPDDGAAEFDGVAGHVVVPYHSLVNPPASFSVEAWVKPNFTGSTRRVVVGSHQLSPARGYALTVRRDGNGDLTADARVGVGADFKTVEVEMGDGTAHDGWRHLVMTYDKVQMVLTISVRAGTQEFTKSEPAVDYKPIEGSEPRDLRLGAGRGNGPSDPVSDEFPGRIDEVALYERVLSPGTITTHFELATKK